jgi:hypothetical protein
MNAGFQHQCLRLIQGDRMNLWSAVQTSTASHYNGSDCLLVGDRLASLLNLNSSPPVLSSICDQNIVLTTLHTAQQLLLTVGWLCLSACVLRQEIEYSESLHSQRSTTLQKPNIADNYAWQRVKTFHDLRTCARDNRCFTTSIEMTWFILILFNDAIIGDMESKQMVW